MSADILSADRADGDKASVAVPAFSFTADRAARDYGDKPVSGLDAAADGRSALLADLGNLWRVNSQEPYTLVANPHRVPIMNGGEANDDSESGEHARPYHAARGGAPTEAGARRPNDLATNSKNG